MLVQGEDLEMNGCTTSVEMLNEGEVVDSGCSHNGLEKVLELWQDIQVCFLEIFHTVVWQVGMSEVGSDFSASQTAKNNSLCQKDKQRAMFSNPAKVNCVAIFSLVVLAAAAAARHSLG